MRIQKKARKWVLNLWTIALSVLSATGLNPFDTMDTPPVQSQIVQDVQLWVDIESGPDAQCTLRGSEDRGPVEGLYRITN